MVLRLATFLCVVLFSTQTFAKEVYTLKFATLIPTGTSWTKLLDSWVNEVELKSNGRIKFKMYPGGVMGDEPDVLRKIRKGQLHGGLFTGYGIGRIYSPARVLEVPFLFKNTDESDYVREQIMPELETLSVKQCQTSQKRLANSYGDNWPYKGYNYPKDKAYNLPTGWVYVHIPTWGVHIRKENDLNYMADL